MSKEYKFDTYTCIWVDINNQTLWCIIILPKPKIKSVIKISGDR